MYNLDLNVGDEIEIYLDYKNQLKYEGTALLVERREVGDTFYMDKEKLHKPFQVRSSLSVKPSEIQLKMNKLSDYLDHYTSADNTNVKRFCKVMKQLCSNKLESYNLMYSEVKQWKEQFGNTPSFINNILKVDTKYIVRYFQQKYLKDWSPTIFRAERWVVDFPVQTHPITGETLFNTPFRTARWIPIVVAINPSNESRYITYNSEIEKETEDEEDTDDDAGNSLDSFSGVFRNEQNGSERDDDGDEDDKDGIEESCSEHGQYLKSDTYSILSD